MAVNGGAVAESMVAGDLGRALPQEEGHLDGEALGMAADGAAAAVALLMGREFELVATPVAQRLDAVGRFGWGAVVLILSGPEGCVGRAPWRC
jgi:hypothetical protein